MIKSYKNNNKMLSLLVLIIMLLRMCTYLYLFIPGNGNIEFPQCAIMGLNLIVRIAFAFYALTFLAKGKVLSMKLLVLLFCCSTAVNVIPFMEGDFTFHAMTLFAVILSPHVLICKGNYKKAYYITFTILLLTIFLAVLRIMNAPTSFEYDYGKVFWILDACNPLAIWIMFFALFAIDVEIKQN